jgi:hypothetical protein
MLAQHGRGRTVAWARAATDAETRIAALAFVFERAGLALNLLAELERTAAERKSAEGHEGQSQARQLTGGAGGRGRSLSLG